MLKLIAIGFGTVAIVIAKAIFQLMLLVLLRVLLQLHIIFRTLFHSIATMSTLKLLLLKILLRSSLNPEL